MDLSVQKNVIVSRTDTINTYLREIQKYPILTPDEEIELFVKMKEGDKEARNKLILCNQRFVFKIAKMYVSGDALLDVVDEGNIGLIKALDESDFDVTKGTRFLTLAVWYIRREIVHYLTNDVNLVKKSNSSKTSFHLNKVKSKFYCENGRFPSDEEIIEIFDKDYGIKINNKSDIYEVKAESINSTFDDDDSNSFENSYDFTSKTSSFNDYEKKINQEKISSDVQFILDSLKERDRDVMKMSFGIGYAKEYTNFEIADELGLTHWSFVELKVSLKDFVFDNKFGRLEDLMHFLIFILLNF